MTNPQALLQLHADKLCDSLQHIQILPSILRWQSAEYERTANVEKMDVMSDLEMLANLFESKIGDLMSAKENVEQILFDIEVARGNL